MAAAAKDVPEEPHTVRSRSLDVLIIEDDVDMRELLEQVLRFEGYSVASVTDGAEALAYLRETPVRLVLLDLVLPAMNGYAFRNAQLREEHLADIPVVIISGTGNLHVAAAELRVRDYLIKPLDFDQLVATVRKYLG